MRANSYCLALWGWVALTTAQAQVALPVYVTFQFGPPLNKVCSGTGIELKVAKNLADTMSELPWRVEPGEAGHPRILVRVKQEGTEWQLQIELSTAIHSEEPDWAKTTFRKPGTEASGRLPRCEDYPTEVAAVFAQKLVKEKRDKFMELLQEFAPLAQEAIVKGMEDGHVSAVLPLDWAGYCGKLALAEFRIESDFGDKIHSVGTGRSHRYPSASYDGITVYYTELKPRAGSPVAITESQIQQLKDLKVVRVLLAKWTTTLFLPPRCVSPAKPVPMEAHLP